MADVTGGDDAVVRPYLVVDLQHVRLMVIDCDVRSCDAQLAVHPLSKTPVFHHHVPALQRRIVDEGASARWRLVVDEVLYRTGGISPEGPIQTQSSSTGRAAD